MLARPIQSDGVSLRLHTGVLLPRALRLDNALPFSRLKNKLQRPRPNLRQLPKARLSGFPESLENLVGQASGVHVVKSKTCPACTRRARQSRVWVTTEPRSGCPHACHVVRVVIHTGKPSWHWCTCVSTIQRLLLNSHGERSSSFEFKSCCGKQARGL